MPRIIWNVGGQEKQKRKKRSGECPENGNRIQSGWKEPQVEGGSCAADKIKCENIAKEMHVNVNRGGM